MKIQDVEIDKVIPYARNPRINEGAVEGVAASIREFGFQQPIVVDEQFTVIVGHTRLKAAQKLGIEKVPVVVASNLSDQQVKAYRILDNKFHERSKWDYELLQLELNDIGIDDALVGLAFDSHDLDVIMQGNWNQGVGDLEFEDGDGSNKVAPILLTQDQREIFERAKKKVLSSEASNDISEGRIVELVCAEYLA